MCCRFFVTDLELESQSGSCKDLVEEFLQATFLMVTTCVRWGPCVLLAMQIACLYHSTRVQRLTCH